MANIILRQSDGAHDGNQYQEHKQNFLSHSDFLL